MIRQLPPDPQLQPTRSGPLRAPLSRRQLGASSTLLRAGLILYALAASARADIIERGPPSFEQEFALSKIVAIARVESGITRSSWSQIYRARVT